jgi:4-amino-4-deoxy-L-arabinose transferase-like glycosyltransferase
MVAAMQPGPARWRTALVAAGLFVAAATARILYVVSVWPQPAVRYPVLDCLAYHDWALSILSGNWLGDRVYYQDPLYPFFLAGLYALFGPDTREVLIAQALLGAASVVVIFAIARTLAGEAAGLVAGVLAASYQVFFFFDALLMKGTLLVFVFSVALWLAVRAAAGGSVWRWLAAGFALGVGCLVRPNALLFAPVLAAFAWRTPGQEPRRRELALLLTALGLLAAIAPIAIRNGVVGGDWVLLNSQGGQNFYIGNFRGNRSGTFVAPRFLRADPRYEEEDFRREAERAVGHPLRPSEVSRYWLERGLDEIAADPAHFARHLARKLVVFANAHEVGDNESYDFFASRVSRFLALPLPGWGVLLPLALCGFAFAWRERPAAVLIAFFATYSAGLLPFFVLSRLRLPVVPVVIAFAAIALVRFAEWVRRRELARAAPALGLLAAGLVATHLPLVHDDPVISYFNLAEAHRVQARAAREQATSLAASGDRAGALAALARLAAEESDAEAELRAGLVVDPRSGRLRTALRNLQATRIVELLRMRRPEEALTLAEGLVREFPEFADSHARLGEVLVRLERRDEAEQAFERALRIDPAHPVARRALARLRGAAPDASPAP